ncbi:MAG: DNA alkylation repair protein [Clostridia bacterium]|nr:DNA alkylation repair protein [Clostridia bacterium]
MIERIRDALFALQDIPYRDFQRKLLPTLPPEKIIGVRTPQLRTLAKQYTNEAGAFLKDLPHKYFEEYNLHAFMLQGMRDFGACISLVNEFLPHVDNWATCDQLRPKCFAKNKEKLLPEIEKWIASDRCYTVRFGIEMLMLHFLQEDFDPKYMAAVAEIKSEEYYISMMIAWYFATALAFRYDEALEYLSEHKLPLWVHNKAIQKAVESRRISDEQKNFLKALRRKIKMEKYALSAAHSPYSPAESCANLSCIVHADCKKQRIH